MPDTENGDGDTDRRRPLTVGAAVSAKEKEVIEKAAAVAGLSPSTFLRRAGMAAVEAVAEHEGRKREAVERLIADAKASDESPESQEGAERG